MPQESSTVPGVMPIEDRGYARPEVLVSTDWVADHLHDPKVRLVESDEDVLLYETGHVPGAVKIDWVADLNDPLIRDYVSRERLQAVLRSKGISQDTTIVFYGDKNNWWACYSFWVLRLFGIEKLRIMDGGRMRWAQEGRPLETAVPSANATTLRSAHSATTSWNTFGTGARWWTCEAPRSSAASGCTCPNIPARGHFAAATFRARRAFPGLAR
jgi:thiosulfate/3-mercaptopyruvate sulfurtransferase